MSDTNSDVYGWSSTYRNLSRFRCFCQLRSEAIYDRILNGAKVQNNMIAAGMKLSCYSILDAIESAEEHHPCARSLVPSQSNRYNSISTLVPQSQILCDPDAMDLSWAWADV
jgi:hypothetical protein